MSPQPWGGSGVQPGHEGAGSAPDPRWRCTLQLVETDDDGMVIGPITEEAAGQLPRACCTTGAALGAQVEHFYVDPHRTTTTRPIVERTLVAGRVDRPWPPSGRALSVRGTMILGMASYEDQDFTDAVFRECDLTRVHLIGVVLQDAVVDGLVSNLVVNGVEVASYVEAELDRRHPVRLLLRSATPGDLREAQQQLQADWATTVEQLGEMPDGSEHQRVEGEWSAVQTLRHLVFVHDSWFRRCCLGSTRAFTAIGLASPFVPDQAEQGLDQDVDPSLDEVLAVRNEQTVELTDWLATVRADELSAAAPVPEGAGWPPYAKGKSVLQCLHVVLNEEWEHHGFCVRDLGQSER